MNFAVGIKDLTMGSKPELPNKAVVYILACNGATLRF